MKDFWLSCGHHLLDRDEGGRLRVTDEFVKSYLARPELAPPTEACPNERRLHAAMLSDPWRTVAPSEIDTITDADARENWRYLIALRDHLAAHRTLEATYTALVRRSVQTPSIFFDHLAQVILRNALHQCDDPFMLRAAELFFRPQRLTVRDGSLLAADQEYIDTNGPAISPLSAMFGLPDQLNVTVLSDNNAQDYWARSDRFDFAFELTAGRRGLDALGSVIGRWMKHLLDIDVRLEPLTELRDITLAWYVGLDVNGTKIGDLLWNGSEIDDATRNRVIGLYRLTFRNFGNIIPRLAGEPVYLILAMAPDRTLRLKPQNLLTGLPVRKAEAVS